MNINTKVGLCQPFLFYTHMEINNNIHNIFASNIAPNPIQFKYWADLNEDPSGKSIKVFKNNKWVNISEGGASGEDLTKLENEVKALTTTVEGKVDKDGDKVLSEKNFTAALETKLNGIQAQANKTTVENILTSDSTTNALSAAQGKALKALIDALTARVTALETPAP